MKHAIICFAFLLIGFSMNAQNMDTAKAAKVDSAFSPKLTGEAYIQEMDLSGKPFFNDNWLKSDILLSTGEMVYGVKLKYNGYLDEVVWMNSSNLDIFKLDKSYIRDFWMRNDTSATAIHFRQINVNDSSASLQPDMFAQVAIEGKTSLFIQRKVSHMVDEIANTGGRNYYRKVLEPTPMYYIKLPSNNYIKMGKLNRRSFLKLFPEQKKAISKLIKGNHLNLKSESGLIKTIDLMNKSGIDWLDSKKSN